LKLKYIYGSSPGTVAVELMINGSSPGIQIFVHDNSFKTAKVIFVKVEIVVIRGEYVYE
jgi:hypothetical protein